MSAFQPIPPKHAAKLIEDAGMGEDGKRLILELAAAGDVKGYARLIETAGQNGDTTEVRDSMIPRAIWKRVIETGRAEEVWSGAVRLDGSGQVGGAPAVNLIGIRFKQETIEDATAAHGSAKPRPIARTSAKNLAVAAEVENSSPGPLFTPATIDLSGPWVDVKTAKRALSVGTTKLYEMMASGKLEWKPIGARGRRISTASIRALGTAKA